MGKRSQKMSKWRPNGIKGHLTVPHHPILPAPPPKKKKARRDVIKFFPEQCDEWLLLLFTGYIFYALSKKFLWVARWASFPFCLLQAGAEWVKANPRVREHQPQEPLNRAG